VSDEGSRGNRKVCGSKKEAMTWLKCLLMCTHDAATVVLILVSVLCVHVFELVDP
jgi:hypothetical protein